ncbi:MAG: NUDIX domain-containing protein [Bacteroidetes bacterium]|nr:MAG: NUDIX domain-containing protein [Bacteroidota bacterium]
MSQMYTIFINDLTVHITRKAPAIGKVVEVTEDPRIWLDKHWDTIVSKPKNMHLYVVTEAPEELWNYIGKRYRHIEAAGGLVRNTLGEVLFIHRLGKWDLPKGKLEEGEDIRECALREVEEECSLTGHTIVEEFPSTYHTYKMGETPVLKRTYWYLMRVEGRPELAPQIEEDITETVWLKEVDWAQVENNTYPSIKSLLETYRFRYK